MDNDKLNGKKASKLSNRKTKRFRNSISKQKKKLIIMLLFLAITSTFNHQNFFSSNNFDS